MTDLPSSLTRTKSASPLLFIVITVFIDMLGYGMITLLIPLYVKEQGGSASLAGTLNSLYALMQFMAGPFIGALSDRFGRKPVLLVCLVGTALAFFMLGIANSLAWIVAAVALDGITGGNLTTAYAYIADVTTPQNRARGMGLVGAAFGLGAMIGPAMGGVLSQYNLHLPAFVACAIALSNLVFGWVALPESLSASLRTRTISWRSLNAVQQFVGLNKLGRIGILLTSMFLLNVAFSGLQTNFPLFAQARFNWDALRIGIFFAFVGICAVFVQGVLFNWLHARIREAYLLIGGLILMTLGLASVAFTQRAEWLYPIVGLAALGSGLGIPSLNSMVSTRVSAGQQGQLMGGVQAILSLALILGPSIAGLAFDRLGSGAPYLVGAVFAAAACAMACLDLSKSRKTVAQE